MRCCFKRPPQKRKSAKALLLNHERRKKSVAKKTTLCKKHPKPPKHPKPTLGRARRGGLPSYCATWAHMFRQSSHGTELEVHTLFFEYSIYLLSNAFSFYGLKVKGILVLHLCLYIDNTINCLFTPPKWLHTPEAAKGWQT